MAARPVGSGPPLWHAWPSLQVRAHRQEGTQAGSRARTALQNPFLGPCLPSLIPGLEVCPVDILPQQLLLLIVGSGLGCSIGCLAATCSSAWPSHALSASSEGQRRCRFRGSSCCKHTITKQVGLLGLALRTHAPANSGAPSGTIGLPPSALPAVAGCTVEPASCSCRPIRGSTIGRAKQRSQWGLRQGASKSLGLLANLLK